jgi:hypothetical protein
MLHRADSPLDFCTLSRPLLSKDRQQDSALPGCQVVRNALTIAPKVKAQFAQLAGKLPAVRLV